MKRGNIMFRVKNFTAREDVNVIDSMGPFTVIEHRRDSSVSPHNAMQAYFCNEMNVRKRQVICELSRGNIICQAGAMQWMAGNVHNSTGVKGLGDLLSKVVRGKATGESAINPEYMGDGIMVTEPTYKHIILLDVAEWNGSIVLEDGLFLACTSGLKQKMVMRTNLSSTVAGGEGLFNLSLEGKGVCCLESDYPQNELIEVSLENDVLKLDGNFAIAWSGSLEFSVEKVTKSFVGAVASGEGLVNVYRGTGKVLFAPFSDIPYDMSAGGNAPRADAQEKNAGKK